MVAGTCVSLCFDRAHVLVVFANGVTHIGVTHIGVTVMRMRAPTDLAATLLNKLTQIPEPSSEDSTSI